MDEPDDFRDDAVSQHADWDVISAALHEGDAQKVRELVASGANLHYKRDCNYDALIDAVHGRDVERDPGLLELLSVLVENGVDLSGTSTYGESGLRVLSRIGRFDAVALLLQAGADKNHLEWSPLHEAVALGKLSDVRAALGRGAELEDRDRWSRTAWHIALLIGDIDKAKLLRDAGADTNAEGQDPPLFYAIQRRRTEMMRWLLQHGVDPHQRNQYGQTSLMEAVQCKDLECVQILLEAGVDVNTAANGTALGHAHSSRDIIMALLNAGANPGDLSSSAQRTLAHLAGAEEAAFASISAGDFRFGRARVFGTSNPERMRVPFWEAMIRCGKSACSARARFKETTGPANEPVWCAYRFGQSCTLLPDGRVVQIGGEHEDAYDPDFCIYNDVFVHGPGGSMAIFGYPREVFPPTDFHTATLLDRRIIIVGSLGYPEDRGPGRTPVFALDLSNFRIDELVTQGNGPGWISGHQASFCADGTITIRHGRAVDEAGRLRDNFDEFTLDLKTLEWRQLTSRNWTQYQILLEDRHLFLLENEPPKEAFYPSSVEHQRHQTGEWEPVRFTVQGVPISMAEETSEIKITIEGELPEELAFRICDEIRANVEAAIGKACRVEKL